MTSLTSFCFFLLPTLNKFHQLFCRFHCWLCISKCQLVILVTLSMKVPGRYFNIAFNILQNYKIENDHKLINSLILSLIISKKSPFTTFWSNHQFCFHLQKPLAKIRRFAEKTLPWVHLKDIICIFLNGLFQKSSKFKRSHYNFC